MDRLPPALSALRAEGLVLDCLFYALGGSPAWFRAEVLPQVLIWESWVCGLPAAAYHRAGQRGSALTAVVESACKAAEQQGDLLQRWPSACGAAISAVWLRLQTVRVFDALGVLWDPAHATLRCWLDSHPAPHRTIELARPECGDRWPAIARGLVERGIWHARSALGRCLQHKGDWALLWPLAARDLLAAIPAQAQDATDQRGLLEELGWYGHLALPCAQPGSASPLAAWRPIDGKTLIWPREDGRLVTVLPVQATFLLRCGVLSRSGQANDSAVST